MTDDYEDVDDQAARDARVVEFILLVEGYAWDFDDIEVIPATATSKAMIRTMAGCAPADRLYRLIEEDAAGFGITAEEFLEIGLGPRGCATNSTTLPMNAGTRPDQQAHQRKTNV